LILHTREWGAGDRVAVLLHGTMADSRAWWRVGPALALRGYRAIGVDLPAPSTWTYRSPSPTTAIQRN
jgi:pimeloyl-ACP methyl ester carboxylesterase